MFAMVARDTNKAMKKFLTLLSMLLAIPLWGAVPVITEAHVHKTDRSVTAWWKSSVIGLENTPSAIGYGYSDGAVNRETIRSANGTNSQVVRSMAIGDLASDSDVFLAIRSRDTVSTWSVDFLCVAVCTNCTAASGGSSFFGDNLSGGSGFDCGGIGQHPKIHTDALSDCGGNGIGAGGGPPCYPVAPNASAALTTPPTVNGGTDTVTSCTDFATKFATCQSDANTAGHVNQLIIPASMVCHPSEQTVPTAAFSIASIGNAAGGCYVHGDTPDKLLPPPGVQTNPSFRALMPTLRVNEDDLSLYAGTGDRFLKFTSAATQRIYLANVNVEGPRWQNMPVKHKTVTAVNSSTDTITLSDITGIVNSMIVFVDLTGTGILGGHGNMVARTVNTGAKTLQLSRLIGGTIADLTGTYGSGGDISRWVALPIASWTDGTPMRANFSAAHHIANFPQAAITGSLAAGKVSVTAPVSYMILTDKTVKVTGTGIATCDGYRRVTATSVTDVTLGGVVCTGASGGTIQAIPYMQVLETSDAELNRFWPVLVIDSDTVEFVGSTAQGAIATPGGLSWDQNYRAQLLGGDGGSGLPNKFTADRVLWWGAGPQRYAFGVTNPGSSTDTAIINSWLVGRSGIALNPLSKTRETADALEDVNVGNDTTGATRLVFDNNTLWPHQKTGAESGGHDETDERMTHNTFWVPDWAVDPSSRSNGGIYRQNYGYETKGMNRVLYEGNYARGCSSGRAAQGQFLFLSNTGSNNIMDQGYHTDISIQGNIIDHCNGGLGMAQSAQGHRFPTARILMRNNLLVHINSSVYCTQRESPGICYATRTPSMLYSVMPVVDFIADHNTVDIDQSKTPFALFFGAHRGQGLQVQDNIITQPEGDSADLLGVVQTCCTGTPPTVNLNGSAAFNEYWTSGTTTDPLSFFRRNAMVGGIEDSWTGSPSAKSNSLLNSDTICRDELAAKPRLLTFADLVFPGAAGACSGNNLDSYNGRRNLTWETGSWVAKAAWSAYGADIPTIREKQGLLSNFAVTALSTTSMGLAWDAPDTTGCYSQYALWVTDRATTWGLSNAANVTDWVQASSGAKHQTRTITGLAGTTKYGYRVGCKKLVEGTFTTGTP